jgi:hypothetical protein
MSVLPERIASIAESQIGVRESTHNGGGAIAEYQRATWLPVGPWAWCAAFVCWVIKQAMGTDKWTFKRPETAGAWDYENWCRGVDNSAKLKKPAPNVRRGDIVVYTFSHIGIAVGEPDEDGNVLVVEGNTNTAGSREGDGVYRKHRPVSKIRSVIRFTV